MHLLFLLGILSALFPGLTIGGKIIYKAGNVTHHHNADSDVTRPYVIHQYICNNKIIDDTIKELDEKMKRLISLLQNKVDMPWNQAIIAGPASSCKEIHEQRRSKGNGAYLLRLDYESVPVYCHMTSSGIGACGGGGWSLVMKINGEKRTFHYDSRFWSDRKHYNLEGGRTGFDSQETKLPTYWNTPFSKICLGMKVGFQKKFIVFNKHANSLHSLIADGQYRSISVGRDTWKKLIGSWASLQTTCDKEGFNVYHSSYSKTRIGIIGSRDNNCYSVDSRIGFGSGGRPDDTNTCGSEAAKAMGYILVQ